MITQIVLKLIALFLMATTAISISKCSYKKEKEKMKWVSIGLTSNLIVFLMIIWIWL